MLSCNEDYYIESGPARFAKAGETGLNGNVYAEETLITAIEETGLTVEQHYDKYLLTGGTPANPFFNVHEYPKAGTGQLNSLTCQGRTG
ncbi:MAG: hypothetical protein K5657_06270 [Desulfovibrio sp.]|nr:hypothetical protein [Desulfovibrio sp.]